MIFVYVPLAALLLYFSFRSVRGGIDYLAHFKHELAKPASGYAPFATVIAPCRGLDKGLAENLRSLLIQRYPSYEVLFVIDDPADPAAKIIEEVSREAAKPAKTVVAPPATTSSQKVKNLREAVRHADESSEILAFVDSDARPDRDWLRSLVAPLADETVGAATGYRWFLTSSSGLAGELCSAWNASIASALGPNTKSNFCWGGSMAIRGDVFERLDIRERWSGALSDDFAVTRAMKRAQMPIVFVPKALTASIQDCSFRGLFEFTNRQMKITRVYASQLWMLSFFGSGLFLLVMIWSAVLAVTSQALSFSWFAAVITLCAVSAMSFGKAWLRLKAVRLALPAYADAIERQRPFQLTLWLITPAVYFANCVAALLSRRIRWRGITYEMTSPEKTNVINYG